MFLFPIMATEAQVAKATTRTEDVQAVFECWKAYHPRALPSPHSGMKEWKKIADRLKDGYTVADLEQAIHGIHVSPFHTGENDRGKSYVSLELCLRDAKHVDQFVEIFEEHQKRKPVLSEKTQRTVRAVNQWLSREDEKGEGDQ